jgi:DNA-binding winged helix-turn-helix (wHTH) protein
MGLHQAQKLLNSNKNNQQSVKTIYRRGEKICKLHIWQGLIFRTYNSKKLKSKKFQIT